MKKMQDAELRVVKFELSDVIVASGGGKSCPPVVADVFDCTSNIQDQCTNNSCNPDLTPTPIGGNDPTVVGCWIDN